MTFIYKFSELREETVEVLLSTASLLQLTTVTNACCAYLKKQLDPCNCLGIALFAEQQSCMALHKSALEYTYQHFMQVRFCVNLSNILIADMLVFTQWYLITAIHPMLKVDCCWKCYLLWHLHLYCSSKSCVRSNWLIRVCNIFAILNKLYLITFFVKIAEK